MSMYAQAKITNFILALITQADNENLELSEYKPLLIKHLFSLAYSYIENHVPEIIDVATNWNEAIIKEIQLKEGKY